MKNARGFTLVELVSVTLVLGILAAFAGAKFINLTNEAAVGNLNNLYGSFYSAVNLTHAQWIAQSKPSSITLKDGSTISMSAAGYPQAPGACNNLVNQLLTDTPELAPWANPFYSTDKIFYLGSGTGICYYVVRTNSGGSFHYFIYIPSTGVITKVNF